MRVLTVARWYPSHDSPGRGSFVADLVRATVAAGVDARVVSFDRVLVRGRPQDRDAVRIAARAAYDRVVSPVSSFVPHGGGDTPALPVARLPVVRRPGTGDAAALIDDHLEALRPFLAQLLARWRPDVIHAHTGLPDGIVAAELGRELGIPVVVSEHMSTIETELADPIALERYRELLAPGVRLLGVSPSVAGRVAALLGVAADRLGVLPNPIEEAGFPLAAPASRDANELLWVGSIGDHKGIDVLLRAFASVRATRPFLRLRLIGGERAGGDRARLEALAAELGVAPDVSFDGWLPRDQVAAAMGRAGLFVHPSPSETFGVAAAEAILTGVPVVARQSGGVPWIIGLSGGYGRVAETDDPASFASAIQAGLEAAPAIAPEDARVRLVRTLGAAAVGEQARAIYEELRTIVPGSGEATAIEIAPPPAAATDARPLPRVLVATERIQAPGLVAALPPEAQSRVVLVVPPAAPDSAEPAWPDLAARIATADPFVPGTPRPRGRSPLARLRRALWHPAPTAEQLLGNAVLREAVGHAGHAFPVDVVAIDAPAAALVASLDPTRVRLAPGSLRWLADRWAAERSGMPPST
jgi:glycosyltransferase involved in cell wall biosynthesis